MASGGATTLRWLAAWAMALVLIGLLAQTRLGYRIVYYVAVLAVLFVILTQYRTVGNLLAPISGG